MKHMDNQIVSIGLSGDPSVCMPMPPTVYATDGTAYPLTPCCARCGRPFHKGHVAQVSIAPSSDRRWRHTDCDDPMLGQESENETRRE